MSEEEKGNIRIRNIRYKDIWYFGIPSIPESFDFDMILKIPVISVLFEKYKFLAKILRSGFATRFVT